ncbi:MAG: hypothetical protein ACRDFR_06640 [Candidatus Limnocylindria bacterium]
MVQVRLEKELQQGFRDALTGILPVGWRMALRSEDRTSDFPADAYLDLTSPGGEHVEACVEFKVRAEPAEVVRLVPWLQRCGSAILVAPELGSRTREILSGAGISWLEPDGDCRIALGSLFIERLTRGPRRRKAGDQDTRYVADLFSGGPLRVVRWLLIEPQRSWTLEDMADRTGLTVGFVSRVFKTLARDAYMDRARGDNRVRDRDALLDAWALAHGAKDAVSERVATVPSTEGILKMIGDSSTTTRYAITAEAAADRIAPFARYIRVEMYVDDVASWDRALGLTAVPRGGNLVLIQPSEAGVFDGAFERDGLQLVSRPQLYVDLVRRGGAAADAAAFVRERGELWPQ